MPKYSASPFNANLMLLPGIPVYLFGSYNDKVSPTSMQVTKVAITSNVATLTVQVYGGNIPAVGSLISVQGTQTASGAFNVTGVALTGVTIDAVTGAGTVTFALSHADVSTTNDAGKAIVPQPVVYESVSNGDSSIPATIADSMGGKSIQGMAVPVADCCLLPICNLQSSI